MQSEHFADTKAVLEQMAVENQRPFLPYELEGEGREESNYRRPSYRDLYTKDLLRRITLPLCLVWVYREYIYYASSMLVPELGEQRGQLFFIVSAA
jgi:hypothetical protein